MCLKVPWHVFHAFWLICSVRLMYYHFGCHQKLKNVCVGRKAGYISLFSLMRLFFYTISTHTSQWVKGRIGKFSIQYMPKGARVCTLSTTSILKVNVINPQETSSSSFQSTAFSFCFKDVSRQYVFDCENKVDPLQFTQILSNPGSVHWFIFPGQKRFKFVLYSL